MKLIGELKKKVEETETKEQIKAIIEDAGVQLTDEELEKVSGGIHIRADLSKTQK